MDEKPISDITDSTFSALTESNAKASADQEVEVNSHPAEGELPEKTDVTSVDFSSEIEPVNNYAMYNETLERIVSHLELIRTDMAGLQTGFDSKIKYDASKERVIDTLHKELQAYREGLHFKIMRPLFFDMIAMHDDLSNLLKYHKNGESESNMVSRLLQNMASFQDTIESILERHGVTAFNDTADHFQPQRQRAIRSEITTDPTKDRLICEHLRKGFEYEGKVLRPESVSLFKFSPPINSNHTPEEVQS